MSQALTIRYATDVEAAKKGMADLAGSIAGNMARVATGLRQNGRVIDSTIAGSVSRVIMGATALQVALAGGAFAGFAVLGKAVGDASEQLDRFVAIGEKASKIGVGAEFFQKFIASAGEAKEAVDALEKALTFAGKQATEKFEEVSATRKLLGDLFSTGFTGDFQSQGLRQFDQATDRQGRIRATVVAMKELRDLGIELAAIKVGETMFGSDFAERMRQGRVDLDAMVTAIDAARGKEIIAAEEIRRAEELRSRIEKAKEEIAAAIGVSFSLAGAGTAILTVWANILETVEKAAKAMNQFGIATDLRAKGLAYQDERRARTDQAYRMMPGMGTRDEQAARDAIEARARMAAFRQSELQGYAQPVVDAPLPNRRPLSLVLNQPSSSSSRPSGGSSTESLDRIESFINTLERARDVAQAELDNIGKSNVERAKSVEMARAEAAARAAQRTLTDAERESVLQLAEAQATLRDRIADVRQQQQQAAETARFFGAEMSDALGAIIVDGRNANEVFSGFLRTLAKAAIQAALLGTGPLAGLFGTAAPASAGTNAIGGVVGLLTGGFRAGGGDVKAGRAYTVGELGRELFVPATDGRVVPIARGAGAGAGGGAPVSVNIAIDARGATPDAVAALQGQLARLEASLPGRIMQTQAEARRRGAM